MSSLRRSTNLNPIASSSKLKLEDSPVAYVGVHDGSDQPVDVIDTMIVSPPAAM